MKKPGESRLLITGICRDVAHFLPRIGVSIKRISAHFSSCKMIVCEGNSSDSTKEALDTLVGNLPFDLEVLHISSSMCHRIERIMEARNTIVDHITKNYSGSDFDYLINMDLDNANLGIRGVMSCWDYAHRDWTSISKGLVNGTVADPFAIRTDNHPNNKCAPDAKARNRGKPAWPAPLTTFVGYHKREKFNSGLPIEVRSAFGSFSIYVFPKVYGIRYNSVKYASPVVVSDVNYDMDCEHVSYCEEIRRRDGKVFINPNMASSGY